MRFYPRQPVKETERLFEARVAREIDVPYTYASWEAVDADDDELIEAFNHIAQTNPLRYNGIGLSLLFYVKGALKIYFDSDPEVRRDTRRLLVTLQNYLDTFPPVFWNYYIGMKKKAFEEYANATGSNRYSSNIMLE